MDHCSIFQMPLITDDNNVDDQSVNDKNFSSNNISVSVKTNHKRIMSSVSVFLFSGTFVILCFHLLAITDAAQYGKVTPISALPSPTTSPSSSSSSLPSLTSSATVKSNMVQMYYPRKARSNPAPTYGQNKHSPSQQKNSKLSQFEMYIFGDNRNGNGKMSSNNYKSSLNKPSAMLFGNAYGQKSPLMNAGGHKTAAMEIHQPSIPSSPTPSPTLQASASMYSSKQNYQQQQQTYSAPVQAAVNSRHSVEYVNVPIEPNNYVPQTILVEAQKIPLNIMFRSKSSQLNVQNEHQPSPGSLQETSSEDEPHHLYHRVTKPIIQEIYELITPYRKIVQEVAPVQENIQTIVSRASPYDSKYVPVNNQFKGKNHINEQGYEQQQLMAPTSASSPRIIEQSSSLPLQPELLYSANTFTATNSNYEQNQKQSSRPQEPMRYIRIDTGNNNAPANTAPQTPPTVQSEPDIFLNLLQTEMNKIKDNYKPQSQTIRNSYMVSPLSLDSLLFADDSVKKHLSLNDNGNQHYLVDTSNEYNTYEIMDSNKNKPIRPSTIIQHEPIKLESYHPEPINNHKNMDNTVSGSLVTTLMPTTNLIKDQQSSSGIMTTTMKPELVTEMDTLVTTSAGNIIENDETNIQPKKQMSIKLTNNNNNNNQNTNENSRAIQSLMMYSGGGSLFVTKPNQLLNSNIMKSLGENRKKHTKLSGYTAESAVPKTYAD